MVEEDPQKKSPTRPDFSAIGLPLALAHVNDFRNTSARSAVPGKERSAAIEAPGEFLSWTFSNVWATTTGCHAVPQSIRNTVNKVSQALPFSSAFPHTNCAKRPSPI
jgi:hypothetical protein